jgi:hypothetical protein
MVASETMILPARRVSKKMHCSSIRDVCCSALRRYNDNVDIAPPDLCSTPASSEAEALTRDDPAQATRGSLGNHL